MKFILPMTELIEKYLSLKWKNREFRGLVFAWMCVVFCLDCWFLWDLSQVFCTVWMTGSRVNCEIKSRGAINNKLLSRTAKQNSWKCAVNCKISEQTFTQRCITQILKHAWICNFWGLGEPSGSYRQGFTCYANQPPWANIMRQN